MMEKPVGFCTSSMTKIPPRDFSLFCWSSPGRKKTKSFFFHDESAYDDGGVHYPQYILINTPIILHHSTRFHETHTIQYHSIVNHPNI